jgi:hypothetical protein
VIELNAKTQIALSMLRIHSSLIGIFGTFEKCNGTMFDFNLLEAHIAILGLNTLAIAITNSL